MFKVVLWDYTGEADAWAKCHLKDDVKVIRTLKPDDPDQAEVILRGDWNFVLIFERNQRELFDEIFKTMHELNVSTENIIFAKDFYSMTSNPAAVYTLLKPERGEVFYRQCNLSHQRRRNKYVNCSVEGVHYVGTSEDNCMIPGMYLNGKNNAADEMRLFYKLSQKYYNINGGGGYSWIWARISAQRLFTSSKNLRPNLRQSRLNLPPKPLNFSASIPF